MPSADILNSVHENAAEHRLAPMILCVRIAALSPEICDNAAILEQPAC
jgi:hypothetical protein